MLVLVHVFQTAIEVFAFDSERGREGGVGATLQQNQFLKLFISYSYIYLFTYRLCKAQKNIFIHTPNDFERISCLWPHTPLIQSAASIARALALNVHENDRRWFHL